MVRTLKYSVGFDLSKEKFDACFCAINSQQQIIIKSACKFDNTLSGFKSALQWIKKHLKEAVPLVCTMEATGIYYEQLSAYLHNQGLFVSVILPNRAKRYLQYLGIKSKNDKIDAKGLARMGAEQDLRQWKPFSDVYYSLRSLTRQHESLSNLRTEMKSKILNQQYLMLKNETVGNQLTVMLQMIENQLKEVDKAIKELIEKDAVLRSKIEKITKIKGLAILSTATVIAETNGFILFENQRQLVSYSGYDIIENQSGNHVGKTKISKKGNAHIRRILHMPALNVVRFNEPIFKNLYERVYDKTKIKMKGYVAVQRKLLIMIYTLWTNDMEYNPINKIISSSNDEPKLLFSLGFEEDKKIPAKAGTLDELPCNESPEVLFSLLQI